MSEVMDGFDGAINSHNKSLKELYDRDAALKVLERNYRQMENDKGNLETELQQRKSQVSELQSELEYIKR